MENNSLNKNKKRKCPICGSNRSKVLYTQRFSKTLLHTVMVCKKCGFIFVHNSHDQEYYNKYYKEMSKYELERDHILHERYYKIINKFIKKQHKIIDIGCSTGHLLSIFKKRGYNNLKGLDPSLECKKIARKKFRISVSAINLYSYSSREKYDCIILAMVLEHLIDIKGCIEKTKELLSEKGVVFISVPDAANFYVDFEEPFGEFSIEHINFFSSYYISILMEEFNCIFLESDGKNLFSVWTRYKSLEDSIDKYIYISDQKMKRIYQLISNLPSDIIVWGVGSLLHRLLSNTDLEKKVIKFVDSDKKLHGKKVNNIEVIPPSDLSKYSNPIFICSFRFREEIVAYIRSRELQNEIIAF